MADLEYTVYVAPQLPIVSSDLPPDVDRRWWSPISSTLIFGERDAVLVDPLMTADQASSLADWVAAANRNLTTIYVTHGHGDHWFGLDTLLKRFPDARAVAPRQVIEHARRQCAPEFLESCWKARFPGQIPERLALPDLLDGDELELEGQTLKVVDFGHTDTDDTTGLHVPSIGLVVAGDAAYNDVHVYLAESPAEGRRAWLAALDTLEALAPSAVVAGHKRPDSPDDPKIIEQTRRYILDFDELVAQASSPEQLYRAMLERHPNRINSGAVWSSARALIG